MSTPLFLLSHCFLDDPHQEADETSDYHTEHYPQPNGASTSSIQVIVDALSVHVVKDDLVGDVVQHSGYLFRISFLYLNYNMLKGFCQPLF